MDRMTDPFLNVFDRETKIGKMKPNWFHPTGVG
jgi:hypothetical protein